MDEYPQRRTISESLAYLEGYAHGIRVVEGKLYIHPDDPAKGIEEARAMVAFLKEGINKQG